MVLPLRYVICLVLFTIVSLHYEYDYIVLYLQCLVFRYYNYQLKPYNHKKSLMCNYGRMQRKVPSWLVCGSHGACLDCMLPGVQVTTRLGFLSVFKSFMLILKIATPCFNRPSLLSGMVYWNAR